MKREIKCDTCGKHLFDTKKSDGASVLEAKKLGFVGKMPFLCGIIGCFFFCDKECYKQWCEKNITEEAKLKGDAAIADFKAGIPKMADDLSKGCARIKEVLNKFIK